MNSSASPPLIPLWPGATSPFSLGADDVQYRIIDSAKAARWDMLFEQLNSRPDYVNVWRPGGHSWFTPLHHAAWHGDAKAITNLVGRGAWLSLETADGRTAADVARGRGHQSAADFLTTPVSAADSAALDTQLQRTLQPLVDKLPYETHRELPETIRYPQTSVLLEQDCRRQLAFHIAGSLVMVHRVSRYLLAEIMSKWMGSGPSYLISDDQVIVVRR